MGITKRLRLRQTQDFAHIRQSGRVYRHPYLILSLAPNALPHNRYGFVTPKNLGKAVARNRVRRLLRESVRLLHPGIKPGFDVVIVARKQGVGQPFAMIQQAVLEMLRRAELLPDEETP